MFQPPINNLEKIRKARKRVKQLLLQIGLESCREILEDYRSEPFCCSLCKFSTKLLSSFKSHLKRYHEDEEDQEHMSTCPSCPFISQSKTVAKHVRIFHAANRKVPAKDTINLPRNSFSFSCTKCSFTDTLYYTMKKHGLLTHHKTVLDSYYSEKPERDLDNASEHRFCCKKCAYTVDSHEALLYHILTSDKHRDLEQTLRADISAINRKRRQLGTNPAVTYDASTAQQTEGVTNSAALSLDEMRMVSFPKMTNQPIELKSAIMKNGIPDITLLSNSPGSAVQNPIPSVGPTVQVGFVNTSLAQTPSITVPQTQSVAMSQSQSITLQAALNQSVFLSPRFPLNQAGTATVLPSTGHILPAGETNMRPAVLPFNQSLPGRLLSVNQPSVLTCPQPLQTNIIVNQTARSVFPGNASVRPGDFAATQTGVPQNTFLASPIFRQLIPTGKQVNGIPTYTLAPISVLPVAPSALPAVNPTKVPIKAKAPEQVVQISHSPASAQTTLSATHEKSATEQKDTTTNATSGPLGKETKLWKTCPVCSELFPSNVYEVHMEIAHIKPDTKLKPTDTIIPSEGKEVVVIAAQVSFMKVLKDKSIRCVTCRTITTNNEILKHMLTHGMVCLYCRAVFHEMRNFIYHMKIMHLDKKNIHVDFAKKGLTLPTDVTGAIRFPRFDFNLTMSQEALGDKEINLAVVMGSNAQAAARFYFKLHPKVSKESGSTDQQVSKCPFCNYILSKTEVYETHLKERHHIMPTVHTILKTPAFKCIHCCGVYTGSMTLSAISVHLLCCRNAPKDSSSGAELPPENNSSNAQSLRGEAPDSPVAGDETSQQAQIPNSDGKETPSVPHKRRRVDHAEEQSEILAMVPNRRKTSSEYKKEFLGQYFNKRPYPSKKEIEVLADLLDMWKSEVASVIGSKRYACMRFLKNHKHRVLLGFQMSRLKKLKHNMDIAENY
uniref:ADNP homeobox 2 n=1 Tax=Leptobrachium leishanense TaxID=445787 RepID=A0A8C5MKG2_9ANUR